ncbi:hypothetical protein CH260_20350 [Rhodococcus sp. 05-2256-B2]|uniref:hypothetical protein n=1 Tax=unclassified Rhodococcus (in: high G+C Gram-positive bacteria) TaxID=192944 RepID=UPI000B9C49D9|nr:MULTISPECIES: hypothetical protein [unclassified Rhodococcus (in: high G+C Gram-positive bacteria)]OZD85299.1 hypothetical protein CH258_13880 [Rhodococcus sp. 05-2256-B4]OZD92445.1 hypothetical protein CH260_20350 [Rhodococcus sp. 05-2256-B2]OZD99329.1 hypothetical protein CH257_00750 [Rhodococcus sp. 05-2256-B3]OZE02853.1 hypothetical protein CH285_12865 [Rhodococcus sp. 05-2256-B1]
MNNPIPQPTTPTIADLEVFLSYVLWGCTAVGIAGMIFGGATLYRSRMSGGDARTAPQICGGGFFVAIAATAVRALLLPVSTGEATDLPAADPAPPSMVDTAPDVPMDWTPVIWFGGITAVLVSVTLAAYLITRTRSHLVDRRNAKKALEADYAAAHAVYSEVADAYAAYLADPYSIFVRPLLDDLTEPRTAAFIDAFAAMNDVRPEHGPDTPERVQAFATAAQKARTAWRSADGYARTMGLRVTSVDDQRTVRRIRSALGIALDTSATGQERETALRTVAELAAGIVTIPDRIYDSAKVAIETTTRKQITS